MLKKIINLGAVYYTVISTVLLLFSWIFGETSAILAPERFLSLLLFSFVMSVGSAVKETSFFGKTGSGVTHAICYIGGFLFCVLIPYGAKFSLAVIGLALFSAGYVIVLITKSALNKKRTNKRPSKAKPEKKTKTKPEQNTEYKNLFSDNK